MSDENPIAEALGRIPSGLFVVTVESADGPLGLVASLVQQVAFDPPSVSVAFASGRDHLVAVRASGHFTINVLGEDNKALMGPFFGDEAPFKQVATTETARGGTVLAEALAWLDCEVSGEHDAGDHTVVFGIVREAHRRSTATPLVHVRKNGLKY